MRWVLMAALGGGMAGCQTPPAEVEDPAPVCDGRLQPGESSIDSPWDRDGDGHFDFNNLFCVQTYGLNRFDCDDENPDINASAVEIICNGIDDDCSFETPDGLDADGDGATDCIDCDDTDPLRSPLDGETCWDEVDNDCDDEVDEDCGPNYNGIFELEVPIFYDCDYGTVDLMISEVEVIWDPPVLSIVPLTVMPEFSVAGTINENGTFSATAELKGGCNQRYRMQGLFSSIDRFDGTFEAEYGSKTCLRCVNALDIRVVGTRVPPKAPD